MGLFPHLHNIVSPYISRGLFAIAHVGWALAFYRLYTDGVSLRFIVNILALAIYEIIGGLGITAAAHRLWSHRSYEGNLFFRSLLMMFNCIAFQGELFYWCRDHRVHHKYSDTPADPHNINYGFFFSHMGWLLTERTEENKKATKEVPVGDLLDDPVITFQLDWYLPLCFLMRFAIPMAIGTWLLGDPWMAFYWNVCLGWCHSLHQTFLVNSAAHTPSFGYRPYDDKMPPTEVGFVTVLAIGEGHHNFHHTYPTDYATSEYGWADTINPTKRFIDFAASMGWIKSRTRFVKGDDGKFHKETIEGYEGEDD
jgi:stearoyl-CoA desaturase (delta-9 desaturase)